MLDAHCHYFPRPDSHTVFYNSVTSTAWGRIPKQSNIIPFYGIHPWYAKTCSKNELTLLDELVAHKKEAGEKFGIGETGLDKTNRNLDEEAQISFFIHHLRLAEKYRLPVSVHCVHAWGLLDEILSDVGSDVPILMHCFSGSIETAKVLLKRNTYFSFGLGVQYIARQQAVLAELPIERIFLETDLGEDFNGDPVEQLEKAYGFVASLKSVPKNALNNFISYNYNNYLGENGDYVKKRL